jgi:glycosyltransferase involved in cell wall biosynthesis
VASSSGNGASPTFFVVIPARNTGSMIGKVLAGLTPRVWRDIHQLVVLDNASTDDTIEQAQHFVESSGLADRIEIVANEVNLGYGGSLQRGLALALASGCSHVIVMHSDDQCDWDTTLRHLIDVASATAAPDVVLACRFLSGADVSEYSVLRRAGNYFFKYYTRAITGLRMADPGTAIMAIRSDVLRGIAFESLDRGFLFHPQLNILLFEDASIRKLETTLDWRDASEDNRFELVRYGLRLLRVLTRYGWARRVRRADPYSALRGLTTEG